MTRYSESFDVTSRDDVVEIIEAIVRFASSCDGCWMFKRSIIHPDLGVVDVVDVKLTLELYGDNQRWYIDRNSFNCEINGIERRFGDFHTITVITIAVAKFLYDD